MKMMMNNMLQRFGRFRQLHTIISRENIKPSSPTPPHLKTHVLSLVDSINPHQHMPFVFFYKNYNHGDINNLKKSLAQCLTQYYLFAGRLLPPSADRIDCNDEGVEFLEASHDNRLDDFIVGKEKDAILHQLIPNFSKNSPNLVEVQLNHFTGGGAAVAVSTSHKVADAVTMLTFIRQWAKVMRGGSSIKPYFFSSSTSYNSSSSSSSSNVKLPEIELKNINAQYFASSYTSYEDVKPPEVNINEVKYVTRRFVFPNSKLNELKKKVISMGIALGNAPLTRVEVLTSLIFTCAVDAATTKTGSFKPSSLIHAVNMRNKLFKNDPEKVGGNVISLVHEKMTDPRQIMLNEVVARLRKAKTEVDERDVQEIGEKWVKLFATLGEDPNLQPYLTTSGCGFPCYDVDFGWGNPILVKFEIPHEENKIILLMDTSHRDGIEATIRLPEEEMNILQHNKELHAYIDA